MIEKNNKNPNIYSFNCHSAYYLPPNNEPYFPPVQRVTLHHFLDQNVYFYPTVKRINQLQPEFLYNPGINASQNFMFDSCRADAPSFSNRVKPELEKHDTDQLSFPAKWRKKGCKSYRQASTVSLEEIWNARNPSPSLKRNQTGTAKALEVNRSSLWRNLTEKGINFYDLVEMELDAARLKYGIYFTKPISQYPKTLNDQGQKNNKKLGHSDPCLDKNSKEQSPAPKQNKKRKFSEAFFDQPEFVKNKDDGPLVQVNRQDQLITTNKSTHHYQSTDSFFGHRYKTDCDQNKIAYPKKQKVSTLVPNYDFSDNIEFPDDNFDDLLNQDLFGFLKY